MSTKAQQFRLQRLTLGAGSLTAVYPPVPCQRVTILNGTAGDVQVSTTDDLADAEYLVITATFERALPGLLDGAYFTQVKPAFWLNAVAGGLVVLIWN